VLERDRVHRAAARAHLRGPHDARRRPVAAFHEHVGPAGADQTGGRVLIEPRHRVHRRERGDERHAVGERVHRPAGPLAEPPRRGIAVQRHQQRGAERARAGQVGDVAAMPEGEYPVGEHQRARRPRRPAHRVVRPEDLALEGRRAGA
jgi:hypothetical protein